MKKFALIGAAGYIAPRHMKAIYETGNELVAAMDIYDSVGVLDRYFPNCSFFAEIERFDRYLEKLQTQNEGLDYISVCTPNYLHDAHCRLGMRVGADVICEKPLVLNPWNLDQLKEIEKKTKKNVFTVLQLRLHPDLIDLKKSLNNEHYNVVIKYITPRGPWYNFSWKGNMGKSGGIVTNIGIHLFDLMIWLFGKEIESVVYINNLNKVAGTSYFKRAKVDWFLSIDRNDLPENHITSYRSIVINDEPIKFDSGFTNLHTKVYEAVLNGCGFGIDDAYPSIKLVHKIRS